MSITTHQNEVGRIQKAQADLQKKLADERRKESSKQKELHRIERSISNASTASSVNTKQQQLSRVTDELARIQKKKAELSKKIADQTTKLHRAQNLLSKDEGKERKKIHDAEKKRERERLVRQRTIKREIETLYVPKARAEEESKRDVQYDAFICHASEDKEEFVRPLVNALQAAGFKVWYDELTLKVGDSLRKSIDEGLLKSRYGIVILSSAFFAKNWPQYELDGLVTMEMEGHKVILPIWHLVSMDQVRNFSPSLAGKVAINTSLSTMDEIASQLSEVLAES